MTVYTLNNNDTTMHIIFFIKRKKKLLRKFKTIEYSYFHDLQGCKSVYHDRIFSMTETNLTKRSSVCVINCFFHVILYTYRYTYIAEHVHEVVRVNF